jgi:hypothetical protein
MFTFVVSSERRYSIVYMLTPAPPSLHGTWNRLWWDKEIERRDPRKRRSCSRESLSKFTILDIPNGWKGRMTLINFPSLYIFSNQINNKTLVVRF